MISERAKVFVANSSAVRAMFEEGNKMRREVGDENVYDFSLGNPNAPAPPEVNEAIIDVVNSVDPVVLHGYMNNAGYEDVREAIAQSLNKRFDTKFGARNLIMTVGAASGMNILFKSILNPGDEVVIFAPYFAEYTNYVANYDGVIVPVEPDTKTFQPNVAAVADKITERTKAVLVNSPHNPTGVVYSEEMIRELVDILEQKQREIGHPIYLVADEPYRELAYDGVQVPWLTGYYDNTIVIYSFSKSLSLPGERIGYVVVPDEADGMQDLLDAMTTANRICGSVNAPSLIQKAIVQCLDCTIDLDFYDRNRKALYEGLQKVGLECIKPQGAFYLFAKSPVPDEKEFVKAAQRHHILLVPGSSFACPGFVRLAYCVAYETIVNSLPAFEALMAEYR